MATEKQQLTQAGPAKDVSRSYHSPLTTLQISINNDNGQPTCDLVNKTTLKSSKVEDYSYVSSFSSLTVRPQNLPSPTNIPMLSWGRVGRFRGYDIRDGEFLPTKLKYSDIWLQLLN